jgi:DNA polymerase I
MNTLIVDTSYLIYRSYFAYPNLTYNDIPIGAFFGFSKTIFYLINNLEIDNLIFALDLPTPTWRHKIFNEYKAGRPEIQADMVSQIPIIQNWCKEITENYLVSDGFEADDCIYTAVSQIEAKNNNKNNVYVFSSDKDLYQILIYENLKFLKLDKQEIKFFGLSEFKSQYGLNPSQWVDYKALVGDNSDNLSGINGIGPKTATKILQEFESMENFLQSEKAKQNIWFQKITENLEKFKLVQKLATLSAVPNLKISDNSLFLDRGLEDFKRYNFNSLVNFYYKNFVPQEQETLF